MIDSEPVEVHIHTHNNCSYSANCTVWSINQSINQTSIAPISLAMWCFCQDAPKPYHWKSEGCIQKLIGLLPRITEWRLYTEAHCTPATYHRMKVLSLHEVHWTPATYHRMKVLSLPEVLYIAWRLQALSSIHTCVCLYIFADFVCERLVKSLTSIWAYIIDSRCAFTYVC